MSSRNVTKAKKAVRKSVPRKAAVSQAPSPQKASAAADESRPFGHTRTPGRVHSKKHDRSRTDTKLTIFNPGRTNQVLPREYFTKLRSAYQGEFPAANFNVGTGALTAAQLVANDPNVPWTSFATIAAWMNSALTTTTKMTNFITLCTPTLYNSCCVLSTKWEFVFDIPATVTNNGLIVTLTPLLNNVNGPTTVSAALKQPFTAHRMIQNVANNDQAASVSIYVDWAKFLGLDPDFYSSYPAYSAVVSPTGVYTSATGIGITLNANMMDLTQPNGPIPFQMITTQYVKFYDFTDATIP